MMTLTQRDITAALFEGLHPLAQFHTDHLLYILKSLSKDNFERVRKAISHFLNHPKLYDVSEEIKETLAIHLDKFVSLKQTDLETFSQGQTLSNIIICIRNYQKTK